MSNTPSTLVLSTALLASALAAPALADETTGTLVAHDRKAHRIVMNDRTVYEYDPETTERPETMTAGMRLRIDFIGGEDGIEKITSISVAE